MHGPDLWIAFRQHEMFGGDAKIYLLTLTDYRHSVFSDNLKRSTSVYLIRCACCFHQLFHGYPYQRRRLAAF
jgi:hypothetical protein